MVGSLKKYHRQRQDEGGNTLTWPGTSSGYPLRGHPGMTTQTEYENIHLTYDARCELLELPKDKKRYEEIIDKCANGWFQLRHERIDYDQDKGIYRVFLQWLEIYGENNEPKLPIIADH